MWKTIPIDERGLLIRASGVAPLQVEEVSPSEVRISCPDPSGPFVLARIYQTIKPLEGRQCSIELLLNQIIVLKGIKRVSDELLGLGKNCWMRINNGVWRVEEGQIT